MSEPSFDHVADRKVRRVLTRPSERILGPELAQALGRTALHIARDSFNEDVPSQALEARATAYVRAEDALQKGNLRASHGALRQCWSV